MTGDDQKNSSTGSVAPLPGSESSFLRMQAQETRLAAQEMRISAQDAYIAKQEARITEQEARIAEQDGEIYRRGEWALGLERELKEAQAAYWSIVKSRSWRITKPFREIKQWLFHPVLQFKRYVKWMLRLLKRLYKAIFRKPAARYRHKRFLMRVAPWVLRLAGVPDARSAAIPKVQIQPTELQDIDPSGIRLDTVAAPLVSVIIPVYGQLHYTLRCLSSIQRNKPRVPFEVIVVDDRSPDESVSVLKKIPGVRLLCNKENSGFIKTCNAGADVAKGQYLCFLNNDTEVLPGWLDEMVRTFSVFPGTGLVGSKLVYPDGTLQEAGGIIWRDGSAWNFGRGQDPSLPVYNYAREVDYCSGASIMVPAELFTGLGGFDIEYCPAYCEDSDLALKIRIRGHRVIYQPGSVVIHYEGKTSGTDTGSGVKAYQIENAKKLFARWKDQLSSYQESGVDVDVAKDRGVKRRVLVLEHCTPTPDSDAGSVSVFNIMMLLREMDFQVTFIPEDNFLYMPKYTMLLQNSGIEVLYAPYVTSVEDHVKEYGSRYDLVFFFRPLVVNRNLGSIKKHCPDARTLFYTHDLHHLRMEREAEIQQSKEMAREAAEMKNLEFDAIRSMDCTIIVSEAEMALLSPQLPDAKLALLPLILDVPGTKASYGERKDIVFVGGYQHRPNVDAVTWFVNEVMPVMRTVLPGVCFHAVGSNPPEEVKQMNCDDVIVEGFVENLPAFLDTMRVSVAPLRYGAGVKGKIGTAMACGLPVVATSMAIEGMGLVNGEDVLVGDDPKAMVQMIAAVYQSQESWESLSRKSIDTANRLWGAEAAWGTLNGIITGIGLASAGRGKKTLFMYCPDMCDIQQREAERCEETNGVKDEYSIKMQQELETFKDQIQVHDLPKIFHYWSGKYLNPLLLEAGYQDVTDVFVKSFSSVMDTVQQNELFHFVSIGAGNCDLEIEVALRLIKKGYSNFSIECLEINHDMLERGRAQSVSLGVAVNMTFTGADFNTWQPKRMYDGCMASHSLHHVVDLEHLFFQLRSHLKEHGVFAVNDMIGRNGHQRWPESLNIVHRFWKELPDAKRYNVLLQRYEDVYENWDCSKEGFEGIRAQDILPLFIKDFHPATFIAFGSAIDIFIDRCFGHHYDPNNEADTKIIDQVHASDEKGIRDGLLTPTHMIGVWTVRPVGNPFYSRNLNPQKCIRFENN